ncbi:hypothetical protein MHYP_G00072330 [Metynnis hypsauchen]
MEAPVHTEFNRASAGQLNPDLVEGPLPEQMEKLDRNQLKPRRPVDLSEVWEKWVERKRQYERETVF